MNRIIGIRRETKSPWERRVPLVPGAIRRLVDNNELQFLVQPSPRRVFADSEFVRAGATVSNDLSSAGVIFGVKEIPPELLQGETTYIYFSHVIKGQPYNMPMLARLLELGCTLIDYEKVADDQDQRLIFFGRYAGLAGMIDALWALGQRLCWEHLDTPLSAVRPAHEYAGLEQAKSEIRSIGEQINTIGLPQQLVPLVIGVAGYGNVAQGAQEILSQLPVRDIEPDQLAGLTADPEALARSVYRVTFREEHLVESREEGHPFELQDYYRNPERYQGRFGGYLPHLTVLMNCNYWDERYPRLVPNDTLRALYEGAEQPRLRLLGDLACDIDGSVQCTWKCTDPSDPVYVYDPLTGKATSGIEGRGPVVLAVDILPAELPRDASESFSEALVPFVPDIARADYSVPFERLVLPDEILKAVIVHRGELTPDFRYLREHLPG